MSDMKHEIRSPYNNEIVGVVEKGSLQESERLLTEAYTVFKDKKQWLKHHERIDILNKLADLVSNEADEFAILIAKEGGKPLTDAKVEVARAIDGIKLATKELIHVMKGEEVPMGYTKPSENHLAFTIREPIGVVVAISAFNHPLNLIVHQVIPAVAVGCPVIVKPATKTPLCCIRFVELLHQAGLEPQWCHNIVCDNEVGTKLASDPRVSFLTFIGSARVGWFLRSQLAPGTRCALEHGGAAPVIVDRSVKDLDAIIPTITKSAFYHAGQVCISAQRVYIHSSMLDEFNKKFKDSVAKLKVGDPTSLDTDVGPLIYPKEVERVSSWVDEAQKEGATVLIGGKKISNVCYEPTILLNPSSKSKVSTSEVFGPVVCVYSYDNVDHAIENANSIDLPFQAAVFGGDLDNIMHIFYNLDANAIIVNDACTFRVDWMPFSGRRSSGYGVAGIGHAMTEMTNYKMAVIKSPNIIR